MAEDKLTTRAEDFSEWYNQLVLRSDLADYAPVRGCMVVKPYGWALWENITSLLDKEFKATGHVNAAFPTLIPGGSFLMLMVPFYIFSRSSSAFFLKESST